MSTAGGRGDIGELKHRLFLKHERQEWPRDQDFPGYALPFQHKSELFRVCCVWGDFLHSFSQRVKIIIIKNRKKCSKTIPDKSYLSRWSFMLKILQIPRFPSAEMQDLTLTYETASSPFRGEVSSREAKAIKIHAILRETIKRQCKATFTVSCKRGA